MTKQEMLAYTESKIEEINALILGTIKDLVCDAWDKGMESANTDKAEEFAREIVEQVKKSIIVPYEMKLPETTNTWELGYTVSNVLDACRQCSNNPANGGSGICHCILGTSPISWGRVQLRADGRELNGR